MGILESLRACYGVCQLVKPEFIATMILGHSLDRRSTTVVRVLGARQLLQSAVISLSPPSEALRRGASMVDVLHASSMVLLALVDRQRRRAALADAAVAGAFAAAELLASTVKPRRGPSRVRPKKR